MDKRTLKLKFDSTYIKKGTGKRVYVYQVSAVKAEDLEKYCEMKGEYLVRNEQDVPLYFTTRPAGNSAKLVINVDTDVMYVDNTEMDTAISTAESIGGIVGAAMATEIAKKLLGNGFNSAPVATPAKTTVTTDEEPDLTK